MMLKQATLVAVFLPLMLTTSGFTLHKKCSSPLGLENKKIPDSSITASSEFNKFHGTSRVRLNTIRNNKGTGAWSAKFNNVNQWLQVDLGQLMLISAVATQGRQDANQWVKSYKILYSQNGKHYETYENGKVFIGNSDRNKLVTHVLSPYIIARYIRIAPKTWQGHISMRLELYGCPQVKGVTVECTNTHMSITIPKNLLNGLDRHDIRLLDHKCVATQVLIKGKHFYQLKTELTRCGTIRQHTLHYVHYINKVTEKPLAKGQKVTRERLVQIPFTCSYKSDRLETARGLEPDQSTLVLSEHAKGTFPLSLDIFKSAKYLAKEIKNGRPIKVNLRQPIFLQVRLSFADPKLYLRSIHCYGTPLKDPSSKPFYDFIAGGCAVDKSVVFYPRKQHTQRFSVAAFRLLPKHKFVYFHCKVRICNGKTGVCAKSCPKVGKREVGVPMSDDDSKLITLTKGPLSLEDESEDLHSNEQTTRDQDEPSFNEDPMENMTESDEQDD